MGGVTVVVNVYVDGKLLDRRITTDEEFDGLETEQWLEQLTEDI